MSSKMAHVALALLLAGCANANSIYRQSTGDDSRVVLVDAKQRAITVAEATTTTRETRVVDGQTTTTTEKSTTAPAYCTEPSPDALSVVSAALSASGTYSNQAAAQLAASLTETGGNIGLRTQTIQILRDAMYRLCEAHTNKAMSPSALQLAHARFQNVMLGLIAIEQLTGYARPQIVAFGSKSSASSALIQESVNTRYLEQSLNHQEEYRNVVKGDLDKTDAEVTKAEQKVEDLKEKEETENATLDSLRQQASKDQQAATAANPQDPTLDKKATDSKEAVKKQEEKVENIEKQRQAAERNLEQLAARLKSQEERLKRVETSIDSLRETLNTTLIGSASTEGPTLVTPSSGGPANSGLAVFGQGASEASVQAVAKAVTDIVALTVYPIDPIDRCMSTLELYGPEYASGQQMCGQYLAVALKNQQQYQFEIRKAALQLALELAKNGQNVDVQKIVTGTLTVDRSLSSLSITIPDALKAKPARPANGDGKAPAPQAAPVPPTPKATPAPAPTQ